MWSFLRSGDRGKTPFGRPNIFLHNLLLVCLFAYQRVTIIIIFIHIVDCHRSTRKNAQAARNTFPRVRLPT